MKSFIPLLAALLGSTSAMVLRSVEPLKSRQSYCPGDLTAYPGGFEFPHLIVKISESEPDTALGNTYSPEFTPNDISTIFNFDVPASDEGKNCSLVFLFPDAAQSSSAYSYSGPGNFVFTGYTPGYGATEQTTYNNQPPVFGTFPPIVLAPGNAYTIDVGPCVSGTVVSGKISTADTTFSYFQDDAACAIGVYVGLSA